jgi:hypothetical protein
MLPAKCQQPVAVAVAAAPSLFKMIFLEHTEGPLTARLMSESDRVMHPLRDTAALALLELKNQPRNFQRKKRLRSPAEEPKAGEASPEAGAEAKPKRNRVRIKLSPKKFRIRLNGNMNYFLTVVCPVFEYQGELVIIAEMFLHANRREIPIVSTGNDSKDRHNRRQNTIQALKRKSNDGHRSRQISANKGYSLTKAFGKRQIEINEKDGFYVTTSGGKIDSFWYCHGEKVFRVPRRSHEKGYRVCLWRLSEVDPRFHNAFFKATTSLPASKTPPLKK